MMMTPELALILSLAVPATGAFGIAVTGAYPNLREAVTLFTASALFAVVLWLLQFHLDGGAATLTIVNLLPDLPIRFEVEPLGLVFALVASGLWIVTSVYSIGYMRGNDEANQTRFYVCFAIALASAIGIAFAGNMLTLFLFYEILTISTYPLVAHKETPEAKAGARIYLGILLTTSILFLLTAVIWTWFAAGTLNFRLGGILAGQIEGPAVAILFALYMFGIGKAALMPFHGWLPAAMVAPTPVSALLHAVAVVKAGVFTVLKVAVYIFGVDFLAISGAADWLLWVAAFTLIATSIIAVTKDNLKARLAYSTISQLAYVTLGVGLATSMGIVGGTMQIVAHALGKITLFMCAGAIYVATHKTEISQMRGLGRLMPFTFGAFLLGSLSIIGLPPTGGAWSKWYLVMGAADTQQLVMIGVLMGSSLLAIAYLIPVVARGFFLPLADQEDRPQAPGHEISTIRWSDMREAPLWCVVPPCLTGILSVLVYFAAPTIAAFISPILGQ